MPVENIISKQAIRLYEMDRRNCDTYKSYLEGDESKIINPENNYRCCWLSKDYPKGIDCPIRICCEEKNIMFCGQCNQFEKCEIMKEFYLKPGYDELRRRMLNEISKRRT